MAGSELGATGRPRPLRWLYGLIAVTLVAVGATAGDLFFYSVPSLFIPFRYVLGSCEVAAQGVDGRLDSAAVTACMAGQSRIYGFVLAAGAAVVLVGAFLMTYAVPLLDRRRLRRFRGPDRPAAEERFGELCDRHGLRGRAAPRLWVAAPQLRHAFTAAVPGRRPTIVVPAGPAIRPDAEFDAIVSHEIAHVLARDVTWVSAVRGPVWLFVPVILVASVPRFIEAGIAVAPVTTLVRMTVLVAAVAVLAAALLRLRELEADRYAAGSGAEAALARLFEPGSAAPAPAPARMPGRGLVARLLARHPSPETRALALQQPRPGFEGGLAQALAVGFVAVLAMGTIYGALSVLSLRLAGWQGAALSCLGGSAVLVTLAPSLFRRAREGRQHPQWWRPLVGMVLGVVLGAFAAPTVSTTGLIGFPIVDADRLGPRVVMVGLLAMLAAGTVAITIGMAVAVAPLDRPWPVRLGLIAVGLTTVAALWPVSSVAAILDTPDRLRYWFEYLLVRTVWPMAGLSLVLAYLVMVIRAPAADTRPDRRARWLVAGAATVVGGAGAALVTATATATSLNDRLRLQQQRWWICAAAGAVVLVVLAAQRRGRHAWPEAVLAAAATTAGATALHYLHARLVGSPPEPDASAVDLVAAPVWLFYLVVLLAPFVVPAAVRDGPEDDAGPTLRAGPAVINTVAVTALAAVLVVTVGAPGGFAGNSLDPSTSAAPIRTAPARNGAERRILTETQARTVADAGARVIPDSWTVEKPRPPSGRQPAATISPEACRPLATDTFLTNGDSFLRAHATGRFATESTRATTELTVDVYSYDRPMAEAMIGAAEAARRVCPGFTYSSRGTTAEFVVLGAAGPALGERSWRYNALVSSKVGKNRIVGSDTFMLVGLGNTVIVGYMSALLESPDERLHLDVLDASIRTLLDLP